MGTELTDNLPEIARSSALQAAIDGLDVTLGDELERYRLWRERGNSITTTRPDLWLKSSSAHTSVSSIEPAPTKLQSPEPANPISIPSDYQDIDLTRTPTAQIPTPISVANPPSASVSDTFSSEPASQISAKINSKISSDSSSALVKKPAPAKAPSVAELDAQLDAQLNTQLDTDTQPDDHLGTAQLITELDTEMDAGIGSELDESLSAWTASYQKEISPPPAPDSEAEEEEDFSIGIAGFISIGLIAFSVVAITFLLFDPFGWLRTQRNPPPPPPASPTSSSVVPPTDPLHPPAIDRELLSAQPDTRPQIQPVSQSLIQPVSQSLSQTLPAGDLPPPEIPSQVVVPVPPRPTAVVSVNAPTPNTPAPNPTVPSPTADPTINSVTPPSEPTTPETAPPPMIVAPSPVEGGNFAVVADPTYQTYVQPIVQPVIRPSDGKLQLGAYGDADTANQKAEEWRRYGVPAVVIPR